MSICSSSGPYVYLNLGFWQAEAILSERSKKMVSQYIIRLIYIFWDLVIFQFRFYGYKYDHQNSSESFILIQIYLLYSIFIKVYPNLIGLATDILSYHNCVISLQARLFCYFKILIFFIFYFFSLSLPNYAQNFSYIYYNTSRFL